MNEEAKASQFEFRDYLQVLYRRKWTIVLAVIVVVSGGLFLSLRQAKVYRATGQILLDTTGTAAAANAGARGIDLSTEIALLESQAVAQLAQKEMPNLGRVSGSQRGSGRILAVSVESVSPRVAAESVNSYVKAFTDFRREQALQKLTIDTEQLQPKIEELRRQVEDVNAELTRQLEDVDTKYRPREGDTPTQARQREQEAARERRAVEDRLRPARDAALSQQFLLENRLRDLQTEANRTLQEAKVITPAGIPSSPVRPRPLQDATMAVGAGLVLGVILAFVYEYLDDSINSREDLQRAIGTKIPVAAVIPAAPETKDSSRSELVALTAPRSAVAEAYRSLRTSVQFLGLESQVGALAITSPISSEGKTTTLANLAAVMASVGVRVVVVDADLRRPRVHELFGLPNSIGFTSVLIGDVPLSAALQEVPGMGRLSLLASGPIPPNPSELLSSKRFAELMKSLRREDTLVLVDTPPLLPVTDAAVISASMDRVLLVTAAGRSTKRQLRHAVEILQQVDAPLMGIVLNRAGGSDRPGYYYYTPVEPNGAPRFKKRDQVSEMDGRAHSAANGSGRSADSLMRRPQETGGRHRP